MKLKDILNLAITNIKHRDLRSYLTIAGIVIGVAAIITIISISLGVSEQINQRINTLGSNIISISAGGQQAQRFGGIGILRPPTQGVRSSFGGSNSEAKITFREADELRTLPGVYKLDARIQSRKTVSYRDKNTSLTIIGTEPQAFKDSVGVDLLYGRYLTTSDQYSAVLGFNIANATFNDLEILNKQIKIGGTPFRVVGILNQTGGTFGGTDSDIFIPQKIAKEMFNQTTDINQIIVVAATDHNTDEVGLEIENSLIALHRVTKETEDFQITTATTIQSAVAGITDVLSLFLGGIGSISLLVGGIGVANTMFMSVLEQTKEIGVLKSLGAKNKDIVFLFLCEASIIGFIGGFLGIILSFIVSTILKTFGLNTVMTLELVLFGLFFSVIIGIIAGIAPARNASRISPVEALKYE